LPTLVWREIHFAAEATADPGAFLKVDPQPLPLTIHRGLKTQEVLVVDPQSKGWGACGSREDVVKVEIPVMVGGRLPKVPSHGPVSGGGGPVKE
jgi:hypothetical protein